MKDRYRHLKGFLRLVLIISIIVFIFSEFQKKKLPDKQDFLNALFEAPIQKEITPKEFKIDKGDYIYNLEASHSYEIAGLVVSAYDSEVWYDILHEHDPLNTKDLCVVWGDNLNNSVYQQMKYSHGEFTCFAEFKTDADRSWYNKFNPTQISNNHMLPANDEVYNSIKKATIGDQIYIKGDLVDYSINTPKGPTGTRTTSTVRDDYGCEIIYTTDFEILKKGNDMYHLMNTVSKYIFLISLVSLLILIFI